MITESECRFAAQVAREAMMYELAHPGNRNYAAMAERVEQIVFDKLIKKSGV